ncbi:MAG: DUF6465 family protein [Lachnospiraceae bacterium]|nr:DUF6465 family protein [Lachnospiraceae bacterium]
MASIRKRAVAPAVPASAVKAEEKKVEAAKPELVKVVETKKEADKAEKKAPAKKAAAKKAPVKAAAKTVETALYLQFQGREVSKDQLEDRLKEVWTKDMGKDLADIKKMTFYVKPEESTAYFVVNDEVEGSFAI